MGEVDGAADLLGVLGLNDGEGLLVGLHSDGGDDHQAGIENLERMRRRMKRGEGRRE